MQNAIHSRTQYWAQAEICTKHQDGYCAVMSYARQCPRLDQKSAGNTKGKIHAMGCVFRPVLLLIVPYLYNNIRLQVFFNSYFFSLMASSTLTRILGHLKWETEDQIWKEKIEEKKGTRMSK